MSDDFDFDLFDNDPFDEDLFMTDMLDEAEEKGLDIWDYSSREELEDAIEGIANPYNDRHPTSYTPRRNIITTGPTSSAQSAHVTGTSQSKHSSHTGSGSTYRPAISIPKQTAPKAKPAPPTPPDPPVRVESGLLLLIFWSIALALVLGYNLLQGWLGEKPEGFWLIISFVFFLLSLLLYWFDKGQYEKALPDYRTELEKYRKALEEYRQKYPPEEHKTPAPAAKPSPTKQPAPAPVLRHGWLIFAMILLGPNVLLWHDILNRKYGFYHPTAFDYYIATILTIIIIGAFGIYISKVRRYFKLKAAYKAQEKKAAAEEQTSAEEEQPMNIGVRFCGGCNPRYDRGAYYRQVVSAYPQHTFSIADENAEEPYDVLLVIGGCPSCCASYSQFPFQRLVKVWDGEKTKIFD